MKELEQMKMLKESIARIEEGSMFPETGKAAVAKGYRAASPKEYASGKYSGFSVMLNGQWYDDLDGALSEEEWLNFFSLSWAKYGTDGMNSTQLEQLANNIINGSGEQDDATPESVLDLMMSVAYPDDEMQDGGWEAIEGQSEVYRTLSGRFDGPEELVRGLPPKLLMQLKAELEDIKNDQNSGF